MGKRRRCGWILFRKFLHSEILGKSTETILRDKFFKVEKGRVLLKDKIKQLAQATNSEIHAMVCRNTHLWSII
jgi:hypothetical protein